MLRTFAHHLLLLPVFLFLLWAAVAGVQWVRHAPKSVTLPNGMMLKLQYYFPRAPVALFATDGRTILARRLEFLCFNDRYVRITSYKLGDSGIYDAQTDAKVRESSMTLLRVSYAQGGEDATAITPACSELFFCSMAKNSRSCRPANGATWTIRR